MLKAFREALIEAGKTTDTINFLWADPQKAAQVTPQGPSAKKGTPENQGGASCVQWPEA